MEVIMKDVCETCKSEEGIMKDGSYCADCCEHKYDPSEHYCCEYCGEQGEPSDCYDEDYGQDR